MKIKLKYVYMIVVCALIILLLVTTNTNLKPGEIRVKTELPKETIKQNSSPSKENVSENVVRHLEILKKDIDERPNDTLKIREYADFLAAAHKQDEAVIYYRKLLNIDPERTDILFSLSYIYYEKQNVPEAEKITEKILSIDRNNLQAMYNMGALAATKGDKNKAKEIWEKLIADHPNSSASNLAKESLQRL